MPVATTDIPEDVVKKNRYSNVLPGTILLDNVSGSVDEATRSTSACCHMTWCAVVLVPAPRTRVYLSEIPDVPYSDYINANFVRVRCTHSHTHAQLGQAPPN